LVSGLSLVPLPPANINAFISNAFPYRATTIVPPCLTPLLMTPNRSPSYFSSSLSEERLATQAIIVRRTPFCRCEADEVSRSNLDLVMRLSRFAHNDIREQT